MAAFERTPAGFAFAAGYFGVRVVQHQAAAQAFEWAQAIFRGDA